MKLTRLRLRKHEGRYAEIARLTPNLSLSWLSKFANGHRNNPTAESLQQVGEALDQIEGIVRATAAEPAEETDPDAKRIVPVESA